MFTSYLITWLRELCEWVGFYSRERREQWRDSMHIITGRLNNPHSLISINNADHIVHKTGTHWDKGHIGKRTPVLHR